MLEDILQQPRIKGRIENIKTAQDEATRLILIKKLFLEIQKSSKSIVDEIGGGIAVTNLDEITTALHNETTRNVKALLDGLKDLKLTSQQQSKIMADALEDSQARLEEDFQTVRIRRPHDKVSVSNLSDIPLVEEVDVTNWPAFEGMFKSLEKTVKESLNINLPAPQINVEAPEVNVAAPILTVPDIEFEPLIKEVRQGLHKIRTNNLSNPVFVRLSDIDRILEKLDEVRKGSMTALSGFPNQMYIKGVGNNIVDPAQQEPSTLKAIANISASTTDGAIITGVAGKIIRVVAASAVTGGTATNLTFNSKPAGSGTAITPLYANGANGGEVLPYNPRGWFDTNVSEGLTATTGSGSTTGILINYILV